MAAKHFYLLLLLLTILSPIHTHARDSQMFNKVPSKLNENVVVVDNNNNNNVNNKETTNKQEDPTSLNTKEQQQPSFVPENENSYGLYGHESGQLPPSSTTTTTTATGEAANNFPYNAKYLPKNYNTVAYVTQPEDFSEFNFEDENNNNNNKNNYYNNNNDANSYYNNNNNNNDANNYYNNRHGANNYNNNDANNYYEDENNNNNNGGNNYNNAGNYYNMQQESLSEARLADSSSYATNPNNNNNNNYNKFGNNNNNNYNSYNIGGRVNRVQQQGMSDTRFLENGRYYYDLNAEKHSRDPFENAKEFALRNQQYNTRGYYGNNYNQVNSYDDQYNNNNNNNNNYNYVERGQEQYHGEEDMP